MTPDTQPYVEGEPANSQPSHSTEHMTPPESQADEGVNSFKVIAIGLGSLLLFGVVTMITSAMWHAQADSLNPQVLEGQNLQVKAEIGIVDQVPFDTNQARRNYETEKNQQLSSYGWVDRSKGTIHIPIRVAMEQLVAQPAAPEAPTAPPADEKPSRKPHPRTGGSRR